MAKKPKSFIREQSRKFVTSYGFIGPCVIKKDRFLLPAENLVVGEHIGNKLVVGYTAFIQLDDLHFIARLVRLDDLFRARIRLSFYDMKYLHDYLLRSCLIRHDDIILKQFLCHLLQAHRRIAVLNRRSEEHTSELQSR